ncbi:nucleotidyltransferase family protein [Xylanibacter ruminicola]|uniref:nucleotidyltransferase family protein n=1 Tax=Xylanibacter ruminicola TaxID=839 RepID=UPI0004916479|nr:nucleotidyltransferase family protein [Xylanibacter ruminicola]
MKSNNIDTFFELLRAGLWESDAQILQYGKIDYNEIMRIADEQSVMGLITAGMDHVQDVKVPQEVSLQFIGQTLQIEQQNIAMNSFIANLIERLRNKDIYALLLKGQGVAQCYERPLWRCGGDVDLFLNDSGYTKAKDFLLPIASSVEPEGKKGKHLGMTIDTWTVELHGTLYGGMSNRINKVMDELQRDVFYGGNVRSWLNERTQVFIPGFDIDAVYVFTHYLNHFYKGGLGVRQVCDWCRLLWAYRDSLNLELLESRVKKMGLMTEWKAFGAFAVDYLGMPTEAMPFYSADVKWKKKADRICAFILEVGNMGHNRDMSYFEKYPYLIRKVCSMSRRCGDLIRHTRVFPMDSLRFFPRIMYVGLRAAARGE